MKPSYQESGVYQEIGDIISSATSLDPASAAQQTNGAASRLCSTGVYDRVRIGDKNIILEHEAGRYAAIYVRVSTAVQRSAEEGFGDGFSEDDQIRRCVERAVKDGRAFRIFSDAGLGGSVPINDPVLLAEMWRQKAELYAEVFDSIMLGSGEWTDAERVALSHHRDAEVKKIMRTGVSPADEDNTGKKRGPDRKPITHRPGLTLLANSLDTIHTVYATDLSRISRSDLLTAYLIQRFRRAKVKVVGTVEEMSWLTGTSFGDQVLGDILSRMAEQKLREVLTGNFRGILQRLKSGRPHGKVPTWCKMATTADARRDPTLRAGQVYLRPERAQAIRTMIETFVEDAAIGEGVYNRIALKLQRAGVKSPNGLSTWSKNAVTHILRNPALIGRQRQFGVEWNVIPAVVSQEEWERLCIYTAPSARVRDQTRQRNEDGYLLTGLLRCRCGRLLNRRESKGFVSYSCRPETAERRANPEVQHVSFSLPDIERWFNGFMTLGYDYILREMEQNSEGERLRFEINRLENNLAAIRYERESRTPSDRASVSESLRSALGDLFDEQMIELAVARQQAELRATEAAISEQIDNYKRALSASVSADEIANMRKELSDWSVLTIKQKNRLLKRLFAEFQVEDHVDGESLVGKSRSTGLRMAPVKIETLRTGHGCWRRIEPIGVFMENLTLAYVELENDPVIKQQLLDSILPLRQAATIWLAKYNQQI